MPTIVATPSATNANSYATLAQLVEFAETVTSVGSFATADQARREAALIEATRLIDRTDFEGIRTVDAQALKWPRRDVYSREYPCRALDSTVIPTGLVNACCWLAIKLLNIDPMSSEQSQGYQSIKIGDFQAVFNGASKPPSHPADEALGTYFRDYLMPDRALRG